MKHFTSISAITLSRVTSIFGRTSAGERPQALPRVASSALLCLALAAAVTGCIGQESPADEELVDSTDLAVTAPINPSDMWSNSVWFVGNSGSADPYSQVRFQYTNSGGATDFTVPINSNGAFTKYMNTGSPYNGDVIRATWSGPGLDDVGCNFVFRYYGGAVYTFAEMGCVVTPRVARVVLNEILVNEPGSATAGEFVELVNIGDGTANLGGWTLSDRVSVRHTFAAGTTLLPGKALVVFGGASARISRCVRCRRAGPRRWRGDCGGCGTRLRRYRAGSRGRRRCTVRGRGVSGKPSHSDREDGHREPGDRGRSAGACSSSGRARRRLGRRKELGHRCKPAVRIRIHRALDDGAQRLGQGFPPPPPAPHAS
jgi:hypothetical protein